MTSGTSTRTSALADDVKTTADQSKEDMQSKAQKKKQAMASTSRGVVDDILSNNRNLTVVNLSVF